MAVKTIAQLKGYFTSGSYPTQQQFADLIDSLRHIEELISVNDLDGLQALLDEKSNSNHQHNYSDLNNKPNLGAISQIAGDYNVNSWEGTSQALNEIKGKINSILTAFNG